MTWQLLVYSFLATKSYLQLLCCCFISFNPAGRASKFAVGLSTCVAMAEQTGYFGHQEAAMNSRTLERLQLLRDCFDS